MPSSGKITQAFTCLAIILRRAAAGTFVRGSKWSDHRRTISACESSIKDTEKGECLAIRQSHRLHSGNHACSLKFIPVN